MVDPIDLLRKIIRDGHLSEENLQAGREYLNQVDRAQRNTALATLLEECKEQYSQGDKKAAVTRYRLEAGIGLREAAIAVGGPGAFL